MDKILLFAFLLFVGCFDGVQVYLCADGGHTLY